MDKLKDEERRRIAREHQAQREPLPEPRFPRADDPRERLKTIARMTPAQAYAYYDHYHEYRAWMTVSRAPKPNRGPTRIIKAEPISTPAQRLRCCEEDWTLWRALSRCWRGAWNRVAGIVRRA